MSMRATARLCLFGAGLLASAAVAGAAPAGLLFRLSADRATTADVAAGSAVPNFQSGVSIVPDGRHGGALRWPDDGYLTWLAPGNLYAQRGTLAFDWRAHMPPGVAPFVIFRAGFADHSSWDMCFLRIDWNGHGFDAFVTDANLARVRVSFRMPQPPAADAWVHLAFGWDEAQGVRLYVDGREVARNATRADLDAGLDQFGFAGRVIAPHQVQSRYNFTRGSDIDELEIYDHLLAPAEIRALAAGGAAAATSDAPVDRTTWLHRYGWDRGSPPALTADSTRIRKLEFSDARDLKQWMWKGVDGIDETTWPGVYNRSRLPGRNDYFTLPDWNTYVEGGQHYVLSVPAGERFDRVELRGAAYGTLDYAADGTHFETLATRAAGSVRSVHEFAPRSGGVLRFDNTAQETPIQELWAYDIGPGREPTGTLTLTYAVQSALDAHSYAALDALNGWIAGRFPAAERSTVVAMPAGAGAPRAAAAAGNAAAGAEAERHGSAAPLVHVLIPSTFGPARAGRPLARAWNYGWENVHDGLDGIAIDLPALQLTPQADGLIPLAIRVRDPLWPDRSLIDVSVSVKPGEARTLWLDTRDRILTSDSLALSIASAAPDFGAAALDGMAIRLVFKDRAAALREHIADRFSQVRDNWGFLVEEHTSSQRAALYRRLYGDISDLLRVDPDNLEARRYWADINYGAPGWPAFRQPTPPAGVPLWAFRQLEDLKLTRQFVDWWIDNRQVPYGDFGGGISDDTDLTEQWPGLALMGVEPERINASLRALSDAAYRNGMITNGLGTIITDELHAYEEGLNSNAERLYLNWGEPLALERLMSNAAALQRLLLKNPAGHVHFASNWYGGTTIYREGPWEWQKPYSFTVLHAPILVGLYNANSIARGEVTGVIDGWLAHGRQDRQGEWSFPNEINWRTDAERAGDSGGATTPLQSALAAWHFSGDEKYLRPIAARLRRAGIGSLAEINENLNAVLDRGDWRDALLRDARGGSDFGRWAAWDQSGDRSWLESLHADAIESKSQHMYMMTEGHWWSDRVEAPNELLQRERLGGIALRRNQTWPGHTVSWRFAEAGGAEQVALLLPGATPRHFKVIAWNTSEHAQRAEMTTWNVTAGRWRVTMPDGSSRELALERSVSTTLEFAPRAESVYDFTLVAAGAPVESRADLGIGADDARVTRGALELTVHSLGAQPTPAGDATLRDAQGRVLARASIPPLAAPLDLQPRTTRVRLALPAGRVIAGLRVQVSLPEGTPEITQLNNAITLH